MIDTFGAWSNTGWPSWSIEPTGSLALPPSVPVAYMSTGWLSESLEKLAGMATLPDQVSESSEFLVMVALTWPPLPPFRLTTNPALAMPAELVIVALIVTFPPSAGTSSG